MKPGKMLRLGVLAGVATAGLSSAGCTTPSGAPNNTGTDALVGGGVGAGAGAALGALAHAPLLGAVVGGLVGSTTGAAIGSNQDAQQYHQDRAAAVAQAQAQVQARWLTAEMVVNMTRQGVRDDLIINQIRTSGCYPVDPPNLDYLNRSGVSPQVIAEMQAVGNRPVVVAPPPGYYYRSRPVYVYGP